MMNIFWLIVAFLVYDFVRPDVELTPRSGRQSYVSGNHDTSMALDGDPSTFSLTLGGNVTEYGGWIQVDLGGVFNIRRVALTNAPGDESQYLINFQILVGTTDQVIPELQTCSVYANLPQVKPGGTYVATCKYEMLLGRYLTIQRHSGPQKSALTIAEIRVFAVPRIPAQNLATSDKLVRQSSTDFDSFTADKANDGDLYTCAFTATESVSRRNISGWWQVDLGGLEEITACLVANVQKEYFSAYQYLETFAVLVSAEPEIVYSEANLCYLFNASSPNNVRYSGSALYLPCGKSKLVGRYVTVLNMASNRRKDALSLCEFLVLYSSESFEPSVVTTAPSTVESTTKEQTTSLATTTLTTVRSTTVTTPVHSSRKEILSTATTTTHASTTSSSPSQTTFMHTNSQTESISSQISSIPATPSLTTESTTFKTTPEVVEVQQKLTSSSSGRITLTLANAFSDIVLTSIGSKPFTSLTNSLSGSESSIRNNSDTTLGLAIGLGVGLGILFLVALALLLAYCCIVRQKTKKQYEDAHKTKTPSNEIYVHPRSGLRPSAFNGVDFSYVPDLPWLHEDSNA